MAQFLDLSLNWVITTAKMSRKIVINYDYLQSWKISSIAALAWQSLIYDSRPDRKWSLKKISKTYFISPSRTTKLFSKDG